MSYKVPVYSYNDNGSGSAKVVGRVTYNTRLDTWDGRNYTFRGQTGIHGGITKLRREIDGKKFVFIHGSQWVGSRDYGYLITDNEARSLLLEADREDLLRKWGLDDGIDLEEEDLDDD